MYSIIEVCGQQFKVAAGDTIMVSSLEGEANTAVSLDKVLLVSEGDTVSVGRPYLKDAMVKATLVSQSRGEKIFVFKKHRRKDYDKKSGHRQSLTELFINEVSFNGKSETATPKVRKAPVVAEKKA